MNATRDEQKTELLAFLRTIQKAGHPIERLREDESIIASGLIDSLAILQIVSYLEERYGIDFSTLGVDAEQLGSIAGILAVVEQANR